MNLRTVLVCLMMTCWAGVCIIVSQVAVLLLLRQLVGAEQLETPMWTAIYDAIAYLLAGAMMIFVPWKIFKKWRTSREELGLKGLPTWADIGLAPVALVAYFALAYVITLIFSKFSWFVVDEAQDVGFNSIYNNVDLLIAYVALCVVAPVAEEIIFRGWLYGKLRQRVHMVWAILLTSLMFGLMHGQWNVGVNVFAMSVIMCLQRELTGTVYSGILTHILKNSIAFYLLYIVT